ncbi:radical SAM family heme chaperone HemW [Clostridiaceae bacterium M8S5]|nr:radical SAM family heme chaperone HemW [Clostridiaceae bacterium M8S5]
MKQLSLYFHIPFCKSKCYYCDFISFPQQENIIKEYIEHMIKEISIYSYLSSKYSISTIFIGGGTPSSIDSSYIQRILYETGKIFTIENNAEITIESNPNSLDKNKATAYKNSGINRISMGVQSLDNRLLRSIGRIHDKYDVYRAYEIIRNAGIDNVNFDIMFNLPRQSINDVLYTLEQTTKLDVDHISLYSLKIEQGTPFFHKYNNDQIALPHEDIERNMYHRSIDYLQSKGYMQYEISNFSKKGFECIHNLTYWKLKPYLGIGLASHSNIDDSRWSNRESFDSYFKEVKEGNRPIEEVIEVRDDKIFEYMMLGLRLTEGIDIDDFYGKFKVDIFDRYGDVLKKHKKEGLLKIEDNKIKLTRRGFDLSNTIFCDLM